MSRGGRLRRVEPTTTSSSGLWTLNEIADYISENKWPRGPVAPTSLSASAGNAQLSLSWTAPATTHGTITNYLVEYTPSGGSAAYVLTGSTSTSYTLTGLTNGTTYTVRVAAVNFTAGDYSNAVTITPSEAAFTFSSVPSGSGTSSNKWQWSLAPYGEVYATVNTSVMANCYIQKNGDDHGDINGDMRVIVRNSSGVVLLNNTSGFTSRQLNVGDSITMRAEWPAYGFAQLWV